MGSKLVGWAWDQQLPATQKLILLALAERATDDDGLCAGGSVVSVARTCGLNARTVQRHIRALDGTVQLVPTIVVSARELRCPGPNRYRLNAPWVSAGAAVLREEVGFTALWRRELLRKGACIHSSVACPECRSRVS